MKYYWDGTLFFHMYIEKYYSSFMVQTDLLVRYSFMNKSFLHEYHYKLNFLLGLCFIDQLSANYQFDLKYISFNSYGQQIMYDFIWRQMRIEVSQ